MSHSTGKPSPQRRLLVVSYFHPPFAGAGGLRWQSLATYLERAGHTVTIVATDAFGRLPVDIEAGVVRTRDLRSSRLLRRVLRRGELVAAGGDRGLEVPPTALLTRTIVPDSHLLSWVPTALAHVRRLLRDGSVECLVTTSPPESAHLIGLLLGAKRPAWIADFRDGWTFEPLRDPFPTAPQRSLDAWLERRVAASADVLVGAYAAVADDLETRFGAHAHYVPNAWDPEAALPAVQPLPPTEAGAFTLVYTGTFSGPRGLDPRPLLEAIRRVCAEESTLPIRLLIAGRQTTEERRLLAQSGLGPRVEHLGMIERRQAIALQRSADALVLLTARRGSAATAKLFEYLAAGKPIIALAENNEAAEIVRDTNTGILVPPDDVDAIAAALCLAASGKLASRYRPRNLERYTYPAPALRIEQLVEEAIRRRLRSRRGESP